MPLKIKSPPIIIEQQYTKYMEKGRDFINDDLIWEQLKSQAKPDPQLVRDLIAKSLEIETLQPEETAALLNVEDPQLWAEMEEAAGKVKKKVYDNRIVFFAPLYCSNFCINNCLYCSFRKDYQQETRRQLSMEEIKKEIEVLAGKMGHKRLISVYGEHPKSDARYIAKTLETIYNVKVPTRKGYGEIRRVNINAAPMSIQDFKLLKEVGIGTYQVFHETYHHQTYNQVHPEGTIKNNYPWRLYTHHRALEAGVDDVALGVLFGLYHWKFEVMGLIYHALELENKFGGIGPHTISFPRLQPAAGAPLTENSLYKVSDEDFKKLIVVIRLSVPYTGMILTAREPASIRKEVIPLGVTQTDASTRIGLGAYSESYNQQEANRQQFMLGDTREMDEVIRELGEMGYITSFCTAGYRCGRTGDHIMKLLKCGKEGHFCKINAILTYREWLDDFASDETREVGEKLIVKEIEEVKQQMPQVYDTMMKYYNRISKGERDLYF